MKTNVLGPPAPGEAAEFYHRYIQLVPEGRLMDELKEQPGRLERLFSGVPEPQTTIPHDPYHWTLKQVVGHLIDCERTFGERLHRFAAGDPQAMPGIDENAYVADMDYARPSMDDLIREWACCRDANLLFVQRLNDDQWDRTGSASGCEFTVRAVVYILAGHFLHHERIMQKRLMMSG